MATQVRDYLGNLIGKNNVGYDANTKGVTVNLNGKTVNLGNDNMTLGDDGRYYTDNPDMLKNLMYKKANLAPVRNTVQQNGGSVDWADGKLVANGNIYNTTGMVNDNGTLWADSSLVNGMTKKPFESKYQQKTDSLLNQLINKNKFSYDPSNDSALKAAQEQSMRAVGEEMNSRGILDSTITGTYSQQAAQQLVPQYRQLAFQEYQAENDRMMNLVSALSNMTTQELTVWRANNEQEYNNRIATAETAQNELSKREAAINEAWNRTETLGYVSNNDAAILGVTPGTPAGWAKQAAENEAAAIRQQARDYENQVALWERQYLLGEAAADSAYKRDSAGAYRDADIQKDLLDYQDSINDGNKLVKSSGGSGGSGGGGGRKQSTKTPDADAPQMSGESVEDAVEAYLSANNLTAETAPPSVIYSIINRSTTDAEERRAYYTYYGIGMFVERLGARK